MIPDEQLDLLYDKHSNKYGEQSIPEWYAFCRELIALAQQEPAQAVPAFWASENIFNDSLRDNIACVLTTTKCAANTVPLYTHPIESKQAVNREYQVWRSTDSCEECWSWDECDEEDYYNAHPTARRIIVIWENNK